MNKNRLWIAQPVFLTSKFVALAQGEPTDARMHFDRVNKALQSDDCCKVMGVN